jgi:hypothetical protein
MLGSAIPILDFDHSTSKPVLQEPTRENLKYTHQPFFAGAIQVQMSVKFPTSDPISQKKTAFAKCLALHFFH